MIEIVTVLAGILLAQASPGPSMRAVFGTLGGRLLPDGARELRD